MKNADAIGLSAMPPAPIMRRTEFVPTYSRLIIEKQDKISFLKNEDVIQRDRNDFDLPENFILTVDELVKLRGGDIEPLIKLIIIIWELAKSYLRQVDLSQLKVTRVLVIEVS